MLFLSIGVQGELWSLSGKGRDITYWLSENGMRYTWSLMNKHALFHYIHVLNWVSSRVSIRREASCASNDSYVLHFNLTSLTPIMNCFELYFHHL